VPGGQSVVILDSVAAIEGAISTLPYAQQLTWQIAVVTPDTPSAVIEYGPLDLHGQRAINAAAPVDATDLTTKGYVDTAIAAIPLPGNPCGIRAPFGLARVSQSFPKSTAE
jgi:hypothetical protein